MEKLLVKCATLLVLFLSLLVGSCVMHQDYRISQAKDPIMMRAALDNYDGETARMLYLSKKEN